MEEMASLRKKKKYITLQVLQRLGFSEEANNVGNQNLVYKMKQLQGELHVS